MGLLKNILSDAIGDGVSKAVGKAVEKAVAPAAERFAQKQAEALENASKKVEQSINAASNEVKEAADAVAESASEAVASAKEAAAAPQRELTEEEKAKAAEAAQALKSLGSLFSGAVAMAKKEMEVEKANKEAAEKAVFDNWETNLGAYPVWDVGGEEFELEEITPMNGHPAFSLHLKGRPYLVELYAAKLRAEGFAAKGTNPADLNADTYYKIIDGVCHAFNRTDAAYDGYISVSFYVDDYVPKPQQPKQQQQTVHADDLKNLAKGIFKKLF
jgi:chemotaxis protein histidine kinase CheA